ncbi:hypothetical protein HK405_012800, partial [Cladochytrium tenue]
MHVAVSPAPQARSRAETIGRSYRNRISTPGQAKAATVTAAAVAGPPCSLTYKVGQGYCCNQCDKVMERLYNMRAHILTHNPGRPRYPCGHCDNDFTRPADQRRHEHNVHNNGAAGHICPSCSKRQKRKDSWLKHMRGCTSVRRSAQAARTPIFAQEPGGAAIGDSVPSTALGNPIETSAIVERLGEAAAAAAATIATAVI